MAAVLGISELIVAVIRFPPVLLAVLLLIAVVLWRSLLAGAVTSLWRRRRWWRLLKLTASAVNYFVQLTAVKPYPATFWTVVYFYSLALRHLELVIRTNRTIHNYSAYRIAS